MAIDLTKTTFKYTVNADGTVTYISNSDGKTQKLSGMDVSSKDLLEICLANYTTAYITGLSTQSVNLGNDLTVGVQKIADADVVINALTENTTIQPEV